ncbi:GNAT family N-acetyltransferase [Paenibacillus larvae]|nr:GNAT family N-acetyltransferase [Paenibacillus larvae]MDT2288636.1 GNAT family N-acetyltransferase [Paenibacillus larvae]
MIDGKLHGAIAYRQKEGVVTISRLMVHPDVFRKGIASRLVLYVMERHPDALWFEVAAGTGNEPALHLYQKLGFQPDGVRPISAGVSLTLLRKRGSAIRTEENKDKGVKKSNTKKRKSAKSDLEKKRTMKASAPFLFPVPFISEIIRQSQPCWKISDNCREYLG